MKQSSLLSFTRKMSQEAKGPAPASEMEAPQAASPLLATDDEGGIACSGGTESVGGAGDDECEVVSVQTRSSLPPPATPATPPPACSGFMPQLGFPMAMNWPFGLVTARQPWEVVVRERTLVLFAKSVEGEQTTAGCITTVASEGETCIPCQRLVDNALLKGEVQQLCAGVERFISYSPQSSVVKCFYHAWCRMETVFSCIVRNPLRSVPMFLTIRWLVGCLLL